MDFSKKSQAKGAMSVWSVRPAMKMLAAVSCVMFMLILGSAPTVEGALAHGVDISRTDLGHLAIPRGIHADVSDTASSYTTPSGSVKSTPSVPTVTETAGAVTGSLSTTVTHTNTHTASLVTPCAPPQTVTVTVTTYASYDGTVATTTAAGGNPPQSQSGASMSASISTTVTSTSIYTQTSHLIASRTRTTYITITIDASTIPTSTSTSTYTSLPDSETSFTTITTTITVVSSPASGSYPSFRGTGTAASASWYASYSANGTFTQGVPSASRTMAVGAASSRGHGAAGFYCVVIAVACAVAGMY
ncbi:hypothetical protein MFIFM68171_10341 [Madurella fahalii]|uniref:Uncharacterized protein n=1 Tax=Madurella fahalii TaxID=1157608 RepID=A0ABQ0GQW1_9PEZI